MKRIADLIIIFTVMLTVFSANNIHAAEIKQQGRETERISFIQKEFDESGLYSSIWWYGWMGIYGGSAAVSFGIAASSGDETAKITQTVSGVQSVLGLAGILLSPMPSACAGRELREMPDATPEERARKLSEGERLLKETAVAQEDGSSLLPHLLNFAVGAAGGLVIWKCYDDEIKKEGDNPGKEGLYNFILSFAVGEIQIFTQPTRGIKAWKSYRSVFNPDSSSRLFIVPRYNGLYAGMAHFF